MDIIKFTDKESKKNLKIKKVKVQHVENKLFFCALFLKKFYVFKI
jgi:hypothetical protein